MNTTDLNLAMLDVIIRHSGHLLRDPICLLSLLQAAAYLLAILVLLRWGHRATWFCYLIVSASYLAEAVVHAMAHP